MLIKTSVLALLSVALATVGQLTLKRGMDHVGYLGADRLSQPLRILVQLLRTPQVWLGFTLFVMSAAVWIVVVSRAPLSFAYPFAGLTYVIITLFSRYILDERVPGLRWTGVGLIVVGIILVALTAPSEPSARESGVSVTSGAQETPDRSAR